ncbi:MAG: Holliday junction ATP-dependent DNA helicase RuvA [Chromatiales bacterium USCg_Taylor]|nr:MAG: Holliday junction ATP-dependent DNA helicase RuvA [Chromatiales bacterium USCg_Taylor]
MIGRIRGLLIEKRPPHLLLEVHGIGYELEAPLSTFDRLPSVNAEVLLYTHLAIRDDAHLLFGFLTESERRLFRALLKVSGIGARTALAILSGSDVEEFTKCIHAGDIARLTHLPGIGKKTAERLVIEMRDRINDWTPRAAAAGGAFAGSHDALADAIEGLVALGYKAHEAGRYVQTIDTAGMTSEAIIRAVLRSQA